MHNSHLISCNYAYKGDIRNLLCQSWGDETGRLFKLNVTFGWKFSPRKKLLLVLPHPRAVFWDEEGPLVTQVSMATEEAVHVLTCHLAVHDEAAFQFHGARRPRVALAHTDAAETNTQTNKYKRYIKTR
jgi:hypothetical protein